MPNRQYESMTRIVHCGLVVRVWRTERIPVFGPDIRVVAAIISVPYSVSKVIVVKDICDTLDKLEDIAAYEVLDNQGNGLVTYPDWK